MYPKKVSYPNISLEKYMLLNHEHTQSGQHHLPAAAGGRLPTVL
jgi:hypothetical protein